MQKFELLWKKIVGEYSSKWCEKMQHLRFFSALVLSEKKCTIYNFPFIEDTKRMMEILEDLGAKITIDEKKKIVEVNPSGINKTKPQ